MQRLIEFTLVDDGPDLRQLPSDGDSFGDRVQPVPVLPTGFGVIAVLDRFL
jgi:hypothetical protein